MPEPETVALALGGGLLATEAVGLTNFSGSGATMPKKPEIIPMPGGGGGTDKTIISPPTGGGGGGGGLASGFANALATVTKSQNNQMATLLKEMRNLEKDVNDKVNETADTNGSTDLTPGYPGPGTNPMRWKDLIPTPDTEGDSTTKDPENYHLQTDYQGPFKELVQGSAEAGAETGQAGSDVIGFAGKSGRTIREAGELLYGGSANTSDTLAKDRGEVSLGGGLAGIGEGLNNLLPGNGNNGGNKNKSNKKDSKRKESGSGKNGTSVPELPFL